MAAKIVAAIAVGLFVYVVSPFLVPVAMGGIFAVLMFPWQEALVRRKLPSWMAATLLTVGVTFLVLIPSGLMFYAGAKTGLQTLGKMEIVRTSGEIQVSRAGFVEELIESERVQKLVEIVNRWVPVDVHEIVASAQEVIQTAVLRVANGLGTIVGQIPSFSINLTVLALAFFFFLLDGRSVVEFIKRNSMFAKARTQSILHSVAILCRSVILASVVSGFLQSVIFAVACLVAGIGNIALIGFATFLASFIPLVGTALITVSIVIYQLALGEVIVGVGLGIVALVVGMLDSFVRPAMLKGAGDLHPLLAFLAAFGGIKMIGISGIFLGPILAGVFVIMIQVLLEKREA